MIKKYALFSNHIHDLLDTSSKPVSYFGLILRRECQKQVSKMKLLGKESMEQIVARLGNINGIIV